MSNFVSWLALALHDIPPSCYVMARTMQRMGSSEWLGRLSLVLLPPLLPQSCCCCCRCSYDYPRAAEPLTVRPHRSTHLVYCVLLACLPLAEGVPLLRNVHHGLFLFWSAGEQFGEGRGSFYNAVHEAGSHTTAARHPPHTPTHPTSSDPLRVKHLG